MISEDLLEHHGIFWRGELEKFIHLDSSQEFASITKMNGLKVFSIHPPASSSSSLASISPLKRFDINLLHRRLGHLHIDGVHKAARQNGWALTDAAPLFYEPCHLAKSSHIICRIFHQRALHPFQ